MRKAILFAIIILTFWAGAVSSISFMEAWIKFQVPGVTLPIGLSIGMKVFRVLNFIEWALLLSYSAILMLSIRKLSPLVKSLSGVLMLVLLVQTFVLLPALSDRALMIIDGKQVADSLDHLYYVILEVVKVTFLIVLSVKLGRRQF
ncbi:hypothetical protein [Marinilabilia salmonicolor]|jgi:hypothetical protein|uniref:DUF4149 domain-containing protein n=1 Tax=Marinilabilia salmonicolor TaxID=989 RepID=A0A368V7F8_9BACT|nr:hypothetical protein [Marinilabilia salmonicolor]RCW36195.1 hypothetical protein DFO77_109159 [Marinilabilia salmonicolor]